MDHGPSEERVPEVLRHDLRPRHEQRTGHPPHRRHHQPLQEQDHRDRVGHHDPAQGHLGHGHHSRRGEGARDAADLSPCGGLHDRNHGERAPELEPVHKVDAEDQGTVGREAQGGHQEEVAQRGLDQQQARPDGLGVHGHDHVRRRPIRTPGDRPCDGLHLDAQQAAGHRRRELYQGGQHPQAHDGDHAHAPAGDDASNVGQGQRQRSRLGAGHDLPGSRAGRSHGLPKSRRLPLGSPRAAERGESGLELHGLGRLRARGRRQR
mmetsp:Transcript_57745/g.148544  ORF Transcript_57745/g.148544 Transcript_57745/m.148544 type:complete len:264 (-) Transcript_57745:341-1132(-)